MKAKVYEQRIFKYATGEAPPAGAQYLSTVAQTTMPDGDPRNMPLTCWFVWHYFLVDVEAPS